jgi:spermidine synthase
MLLHDTGLKHNTDKATYHKYLDFYQKHLPKRTFKGRLLEIGVMDGGSLRMWREYYPKAEIIGVDNAMQSDLRIDGVELITLDATDPTALKELGKFDIIIDDGSHKTADQQKTFEQLFYSQLKKGGYYILEDLHTSLMPSYINSDVTTIDYLKKLKGVKITHYHNKDNPKDSMTCIIEGK